MSAKDKLNIGQDYTDAPQSESYSVGQLAEENENDSNNNNDNTNNEQSLSPSPAVKLNRVFQDNPFKDRLSRTKFLTNKHDAILKQFSSTHFNVPSANNLLSPTTQKLISNISPLDEDDGGHGNNDSSSSDEANDEIDVDDTEPLIFEFPYVMYSIYLISK